MNISSVATGGRRGLAQLTLIAMLLVLCAGLEPTQVYAQIYGEEDSNCPARHGNPDSTAPPSSFPWLNNALAPDQRVELLLAQMTLEEKVDLVTGDSCGLYGFFNAPIPRLHIPALTMTDGPAGVRVANPATNNGKATAMPAPIALAATWDITQASTYGGILGSEAFLTGHNVLLGPAIDLVRVALAGRGFETFGEDPQLTSDMAVPYIQAIQQHPVLANAKHADEYNQETDRLDGINVIIDERPRVELYGKPFENAIERADVATAMCSFNKVNGLYQCEDPFTLTTLLKDLFGLDGFILSDFGANQSTVASALAGLDMEQPGEGFWGSKLLAAVNARTVPQATLDDKVRRILRVMFKHRLFDTPVQIGPLSTAADGHTARLIAEQSAVLLQNTNNLLPLTAGSLKAIAVIGADADNASAQGGGSSKVVPTYAVSPLAGIESAVGSGVAVKYSQGTDPVTAAHVLPGGDSAVPSSVLTPTGQAGRQGLLATYWLNTNFSGTPALSRVERQVALMLGFTNFTNLGASSLPGWPQDFNSTKLSARWTGTLTAQVAGDYAFTLTTRGEGTLFIDGATVIADTTPHPRASSSGTVHLTAGSHDIRVDYIGNDSSIGAGGGTVGGEALLSWTPPAGVVSPAITAAATTAKAADAAVVFVRDYETEGDDRSTLSLPNGQDHLIAQVAAANPHTIVVVQTGAPITMPWLHSVPAVLQAWYGGQEQGNAIAAILFGQVNPSGKLPVSFPPSIAQSPTSTPQQFPGVALRVDYSEGIYLGYRWFDHFNVQPLFPFGFGLSYTTFTYNGLQIQSTTPSAGELQQPVQVSFTVTNAGRRAGAEIAQVYIGNLPGVATPPRQLAAFSKVNLAAGATATVTLQIEPKSFTYWNATTHEFVTPTGSVPIYVGSSSRDIHLTGSVQIGPASTGGS